MALCRGRVQTNMSSHSSNGLIHPGVVSIGPSFAWDVGAGDDVVGAPSDRGCLGHVKRRPSATIHPEEDYRRVSPGQHSQCRRRPAWLFVWAPPMARSGTDQPVVSISGWGCPSSSRRQDPVQWACKLLLIGQGEYASSVAEHVVRAARLDENGASLCV